MTKMRKEILVANLLLAFRVSLFEGWLSPRTAYMRNSHGTTVVENFALKPQIFYIQNQIQFYTTSSLYSQGLKLPSLISLLEYSFLK